jgi:hypothetical protein
MVTSAMDADLINPWGIPHGASSSFWVSDDDTGTARFHGDTFIFASENGTIADGREALGTAAETLFTISNAIYKGLGISTTADTLFAANFDAGTIERFDSAHTASMGWFSDPIAPASYGQLDSPWGLALARATFGEFAGDPLVGNVGIGEINAFEPSTRGNAMAQHIAPSALLTIDQNRATVVERIVDEWGDRLARSNAGSAAQLRQILSGLRSDHLQAASLAGSVEGLRDVVSGAPVPTDAAVSPTLMHTKSLVDIADDLVYTPVVPCRIVDTRSGAGGIFLPTNQRNWLVYSPSGFASQGGSATSCGIPVRPVAVMMNTTLANTVGGPEFFTLWPFNQARPNASTVTWWGSGQQPANAEIVRLCTGRCTSDFSAYASGQTHAIIDVLGYFDRPTNFGGTHAFTGANATDLGGGSNTASGDYSAVAGGFRNAAGGGIYSTVAGNTTGYAGARLPTGADALSALSDRSKELVLAVDAGAVPHQIIALPIATWNWTAQGTATRHMGPTTQDVRQALGFPQLLIDVTVDENGSGIGTIGHGFVAPDPGPGGLIALTYPLPFAGTQGDVILTDDSRALDLVRFNGNGTLVFYSDNVPTFDALADTPNPSGALYSNQIFIAELGFNVEGNNGALYTPAAGQPGFAPGVTYHFVSDGTVAAVPEPGTLALLGAGLAGLSFWRRRK